MNAKIPFLDPSPRNRFSGFNLHGLLPHGIYGAFLGLWCLLSFPHFSVADIRSFGLGPLFLSLAEATQHAGFYARNLGGTLIPEVQREPLYPWVLVLLQGLGKSPTGILLFQKGALWVSLWIWTQGFHRRYGWKTSVLFLGLLLGSSTIPFYASLFYAYAFHFLFITLFLFAFTKFVESQRVTVGVLAGLALGTATYERGTYLLLAPFMAGFLLWLHRKSLTSGIKLTVVFLAAALILPSPWLWRNATLGIKGMNQMSGYALGYTFGYLTYNSKDAEDVRLQGFFNRLDTDLGSQKFIEDGVWNRLGSFQAMDQKMARLITHRMQGFKRKTAGIMIANMSLFPSRLLSGKPCLLLGKEITPAGFYANYARVRKPTFWDWTILFAAILGMAMGWRKRDALLMVGSVVTLYVFLVSTLPVTFDPRYRGPVDPMLYGSAAFFFHAALLGFRRILARSPWVVAKQLSHNSSQLDDPQTTDFIHRNLIARKPFLRKLYLEFYETFLGQIKDSRPYPHPHTDPHTDPIWVELGSGGGFLKQIEPRILTTDVLALSKIDLRVSAMAMPFKSGSVDAFFLLDTFHHIPNVAHFLSEAQRCLKDQGVMVMMEPANTWWGRFIYTHFHHEAFDPKADWTFESRGPLSSANGALPWIVFSRDRQRFETEFPELRLRRFEAHTPFRYLLSGGFSKPQLMPTWSFSLWRGFEKMLSPVSNGLGMFYWIAIEKRKPGVDGMGAQDIEDR